MALERAPWKTLQAQIKAKDEVNPERRWEQLVRAMMAQRIRERWLDRVKYPEKRPNIEYGTV